MRTGFLYFLAVFFFLLAAINYIVVTYDPNKVNPSISIGIFGIGIAFLVLGWMRRKKK